MSPWDLIRNKLRPASDSVGPSYSCSGDRQWQVWFAAVQWNRASCAVHELLHPPPPPRPCPVPCGMQATHGKAHMHRGLALTGRFARHTNLHRFFSRTFLKFCVFECLQSSTSSEGWLGEARRGVLGRISLPSSAYTFAELILIRSHPPPPSRRALERTVHAIQAWSSNTTSDRSGYAARR